MVGGDVSSYFAYLVIMSRRRPPLLHPERWERGDDLDVSNRLPQRVFCLQRFGVFHSPRSLCPRPPVTRDAR